MKKGFTLIELLAVIVLLAVISVLGTVGVNGVKKMIDNEVWKGTVSLIENAAINYGEDHKNHFSNCTKDSKDECKVLISTLIERGYISTNKLENPENENSKKILVDERKDANDKNYIINETEVLIYIENNQVYARYEEAS